MLLLVDAVAAVLPASPSIAEGSMTVIADDFVAVVGVAVRSLVEKMLAVA